MSEHRNGLFVLAGVLLRKDPYTSPNCCWPFPVCLFLLRSMEEEDLSSGPCLQRHTEVEGLQNSLFHGCAFSCLLSSHYKCTWYVAAKCNCKVQLTGRMGKIFAGEFCEVW